MMHNCICHKGHHDVLVNGWQQGTTALSGGDTPTLQMTCIILYFLGCCYSLTEISLVGQMWLVVF